MGQREGGKSSKSKGEDAGPGFHVRVTCGSVYSKRNRGQQSGRSLLLLFLLPVHAFQHALRIKMLTTYQSCIGAVLHGATIFFQSWATCFAPSFAVEAFEIDYSSC